MPRGHNSKLRAREKRRQARKETHSMKDAPATSAEESVETPFLSPLRSVDIQHSSDAESPGKSKKSQKPTTASVSALFMKSDEDANSQNDERPSTSWALSPAGTSSSTVRDSTAVSLVQFMLQRYKMNKPITKEEILKHVTPQNKEEFPEILKKASQLMMLTFGIDIKEIDPTKHRYAFVSILRPNGNEILNGEKVEPKNGLLMLILCLIFMNDNCANEDYIWKVFNVMGIYAGVNHTIYGNVKKLMTKDFVMEGYLEYRQVPIKGSSCHQFLWGSRAQRETSKMRVLEFLAKIHNTVPTAYPSLYQDALRAEQERIRSRFVAMILGLMDDEPPDGNSSNSFILH